MKGPAHRALHPFGQVPTYEEGDLVLFESGAIVLHIAQHHPGLLPEEGSARARAIAWMFAAINTIEVPVWDRAMTRVLEGDRSWAGERLALIEGRVRERLVQLAERLRGRDWLEGDFIVGDLMMVSVLRHTAARDIAAEFPDLAAYVARGEARPAFQRALGAQLAELCSDNQGEGHS
jgi:glutathione S-transferase